MPSAIQHRWNDLATDEPVALLTRRRVIGEQAMISHVVLRKGCDVLMHAHPNEQFSCVLSGKVRFSIGAHDGAAPREMVLQGGEVIHLPSNVPHAAFALEETVILDIFSPPSAGTGIDHQKQRDGHSG